MKRSLLIALMTILLLLTLVLASCASGNSDVLTGVDVKFSTLSAKGSLATGEVSNATETYSFLSEIAVAEGATYTVAADVFGNEVYTFKTVPLVEGENTFYVFVENGNEMTMYTVVIYRTPVYIVTVDLGDGSEPTEQRVEEGKHANIPTPTREGYTFLGWNQDASMPITINTYFLANWKPNEYSITYDLNDGTNHPSNPSTYTIEDTVTLNTPQREGYAFAGWLLDGEVITQIPKGTEGNITLVATWRNAVPVPVPGIDEVALNVSNDITYTGSALKGNAYALANARKIQEYVSVAYTFKKVDTDGNMIADLGTERPVDAGRYTVTATFTFNEGYTAEQYILPEPMTATIVIKPANLS